MASWRRFGFSILAPSLLGVLALLISGCGSLGGEQNTFSPSGRVAQDQLDLFLLALWPAIVILILVFALLTYALIRFRRKRDDEPPPKQIHGNTRLEVAWTIGPALLLLALGVPMLMMIVSLGRAAEDDALHVRVTGQRFSWTFEYPDIKKPDGTPLSIVGTPEQPAELHAPVDREIAFDLESVDVIHSFWTPRLAGKRDAVPGRTNTLWFTIDEPGRYPGQCAEFCGLLHAEMKFAVVGHTQEDFHTWCEEQIEVPAGDPACRV